jgi:hypothetical protein
MFRLRFGAFTLVILAMSSCVVHAQRSIDPTFTYQGQLKLDGTSVTDNCSFEFSLWDDPTAGNQIGMTQTIYDHPVVDGLFTVLLNGAGEFGPDAFNGQPRWLEITAAIGEGSPVTLSPRQPVTAAPYAYYGQTAPWAGLLEMPAGFADGTDDDTTYNAGAGLVYEPSESRFSLDPLYMLPQACADGQVAKWDGNANTWVCGDDEVGVSGDFWSLIGNAGTVPGTNFLGTTDGAALELRVNNTTALRLLPDPTSPNLVGGHADNDVVPGVRGATISGGGVGTLSNRVTDNYGVIGGGANNQAGDNAGTTDDRTFAVIGGGYYNTASGTQATVGGGFFNTASGTQGTVAGGTSNQASGQYGAVCGGYANQAWAVAASALGGSNNLARYDYATVGGGQANHADATYALVGGGKSNSIVSSYGTIAGGNSNSVAGEASTIGGGEFNATTSAYSNYATIAGGSYNAAHADYATIAGGGPSDPGDPSNTRNQVWDKYGVIGGGGGNYAGSMDGDSESSMYATVAGGRENTAYGPYVVIGGGFQNEARRSTSVIAGGHENYSDSLEATISGGGLHSITGGDFATGGHDTIGGGRANTIADADFSVIGGGTWNEISADYATIGGGGPVYPDHPADSNNRVVDAYGTIAGGGGNIAGSQDADPNSSIYATIGGGRGNQASAHFTSISGGIANTASGDYATVGGGGINAATSVSAVVAGGFQNTAGARDATIGGGYSNIANGLGATVAGGQFNRALADFATIGGGSSSDQDGGILDTYNRVYDKYGTIAGGGGNWAGSDDADPETSIYATISGGENNNAAASFATIGGGQANTVSNDWGTVAGGVGNVVEGSTGTIGGGSLCIARGNGSTVAGGASNLAEGHFASIAGGQSNVANGDYASIPGGQFNEAEASYSFAAGRRAKALSAGSFVWADSTDANVQDAGPDTFSIRATNGIYAEANDGSCAAQFGNSGDGDGIRAYANASSGNNWAALYAINSGTSPAIYGYSYGGPAAHFDGDVQVTGTVAKEYASASYHSALPIAYGYIQLDGSVGAATPNVSSTWNEAQERFEITIAGETYDQTQYVTVVTPVGTYSPFTVFTSSESGKLLVRIFNVSPDAVRSEFNFVVYKPGEVTATSLQSGDGYEAAPDDSKPGPQRADSIDAQIAAKSSVSELRQQVAELTARLETLEALLGGQANENGRDGR